MAALVRSARRMKNRSAHGLGRNSLLQVDRSGPIPLQIAPLIQGPPVFPKEARE